MWLLVPAAWELDHVALEGEVAAQDRDAARLLDRLGDRVDYLLPGRLLRGRGLLEEALAADVGEIDGDVLAQRLQMIGVFPEIPILRGERKSDPTRPGCSLPTTNKPKPEERPANSFSFKHLLGNPL